MSRNPKRRSGPLKSMRFSVMLHTSNFVRQNSMFSGLDTSGLNFNVKDFSDEKITLIKDNPFLRVKAIEWLIKNKGTMEGSTKVLIQLCKDMPFFKPITSKFSGDKVIQMITKFFKGAEHEKMSANNLLFREGDPSNDKCYVIIKGRVMVLRHESRHRIKLGKQKPKKEMSSKDTDSTPKSSDSQNPEDKSGEKDEQGTSSSRRSTKRSRSSSIVSKKSLLDFTKKPPEDLEPEPVRSRKMSIMKGDVEIKVDSRPMSPRKKDRQRSKFGQNREASKPGSKIKNKLLLEGLSDEIIMGMEPYGEPIVIIDAGKIFGQFALESDNPRNASIYTIDDCDFMTFQKKDYKFIMKFYNHEFNERRKTVEKFFPRSNQLIEDKKLQFVQFFDPKIKTRGKVLAQEGQKGQNIYIIQKGSCLVSKLIELESKDKKIIKKVIICRVGPGSLIGEEIIFKPHIYKFTVEVESSQIKVLNIKTTQGIKQFRGYNIFETLRKPFEIKEKNRLEFLDNLLIRVPSYVFDCFKQNQCKTERFQLLNSGPFSSEEFKAKQPQITNPKEKEAWLSAIQKFVSKHKRLTNTESLSKQLSLESDQNIQTIDDSNIAAIMSYFNQNSRDVKNVLKNNFKEMENNGEPNFMIIDDTEHQLDRAPVDQRRHSFSIFERKVTNNDRLNDPPFPFNVLDQIQNGKTKRRERSLKVKQNEEKLNLFLEVGKDRLRPEKANRKKKSKKRFKNPSCLDFMKRSLSTTKKMDHLVPQTPRVHARSTSNLNQGGFFQRVQTQGDQLKLEKKNKEYDLLTSLSSRILNQQKYIHRNRRSLIVKSDRGTGLERLAPMKIKNIGVANQHASSLHFVNERVKAKLDMRLLKNKKRHSQINLDKQIKKSNLLNSKRRSIALLPHNQSESLPPEDMKNNNSQVYSLHKMSTHDMLEGSSAFAFNVKGRKDRQSSHNNSSGIDFKQEEYFRKDIFDEDSTTKSKMGFTARKNRSEIRMNNVSTKETFSVNKTQKNDDTSHAGQSWNKSTFGERDFRIKDNSTKRKTPKIPGYGRPPNSFIQKEILQGKAKNFGGSYSPKVGSNGLKRFSTMKGLNKNFESRKAKGDTPKARLTPARRFVAGFDFAGSMKKGNHDSDLGLVIESSVSDRDLDD